MTRGAIIIGLVLTTVVGTADAQLRCQAKKLKAAATRTSDLAKCVQRALLGGGGVVNPDCVARAEQRLDAAVAKADADDAPCAGDPAALGAAVQTCIDGYLDEVTPTTTTPTSTTSTTLPCAAGQPVGNACWFLSTQGESCEGVCARQGLSYDAATETYAGSGGTADACSAVLLALGVNVPFADATCPSGLGCVGGIVLSAPVGLRCTAPPTDRTSSHPDFLRACACH